MPLPELWYGGVALCGLGHEQLQAGANATPDMVVTTPMLKTISDVALDANGNAWVVGSGSDYVFRFAAAAVRPPAVMPMKSTPVEPDLVIRSPALKSPGNLAFDASGSLWVANRPPAGATMPDGGAMPDAATMTPDGGAMPSDGSIVRFDIPSGASGMQDLSPIARITSATAGDLSNIGNIAFDRAQNLWLTSFVGLLRFDDPRSKSGDVVLAPGAVIDKTGYANNIYFYSVAFDAKGALWATSADGLHYLTSVTEFKNPGLLGGRSSPVAAATIMGVADRLPAGGLAFDTAGNLWQANNDSILMYSGPGDLSGSVNPTPAITIKVMGVATPTTNSHLAFFPLPPSSGTTDAGADDAAADDVTGDGCVPTPIRPVCGATDAEADDAAADDANGGG